MIAKKVYLGLSVPIAIWPTIEQVLVTALLGLLAYGVDKLMTWIKYKIDTHLEVPELGGTD